MIYQNEPSVICNRCGVRLRVSEIDAASPTCFVCGADLPTRRPKTVDRIKRGGVTRDLSSSAPRSVGRRLLEAIRKAARRSYLAVFVPRW